MTKQVQKFPVGTKIKHKSGETIYTIRDFAGRIYFVSWILEDGTEEAAALANWCVEKYYEEYKEPQKISLWVPVVKTEHGVYVAEKFFGSRAKALRYTPYHVLNKVINAVEVTYEEKT